VEAATDGSRIELQSPSGDAKFELVFGRALARAGAVRTVDDTPARPLRRIGPAGGGQRRWRRRSARLGIAPAATAATASASTDPAAAGKGDPERITYRYGGQTTPGAAWRRTRLRLGSGSGGFTAFDPVAGSVAPGNAPNPSDASPAPAQLAARAAPARLTAQPVALAMTCRPGAHDVRPPSSVSSWPAWPSGSGRRTRRFGGSA